MSRREPVGAQRQAVYSEAQHLVVLAPPGCGKTEVLAMRADHLLKIGAIRPGRRLLAVTFTNRARDNLRHRLADQLGHGRLRDGVAVVNFHEISARILEAHHKTIGITPGFAFPRPAWQRRTLADITTDRAAQRAAKEALALLSRQPLTDDELLERLSDSGNSVAMELEQRRRKENYIDYGDLQRLAQLTLRNSRVAGLFQSHFDAVLVDEFQDLSLQQHEIAGHLCSANSTYVGDPYQGIFAWAGAQTTEVFADLASRAGEIISLDVSFRSSPAVLKVVNAVSASLGATALHAADPTAWESGGYAYAATYESDRAEAADIVALTDWLTATYPEDTIGVICRAAYRRGALDRSYTRSDRDAQFWDIALDTPRVGRILRRHAPYVDVSASFEGQVADLGRRAIGAVRPTDIDTIAELNDACEQLLEHRSDGLSVPDVVRRLRDNQSAAAIGPGVHVLNAHVGKGQQFDWVIVMGLEEGHVPSVYSETPAEYLEDQRVLLVMLSRARKGLVITHATSTTNQYGKTFRNRPSRWWGPMAAECQPLSLPVA